jgi:hypothetical protein
MRCQRCGLGVLKAQSPGLEAVSLRRGDKVYAGDYEFEEGKDEGAGAEASPGSSQLIVGTSRLLQRPAAFLPEQVAFVAAEGSVGLMAEWPTALDMACRLAGLYDSPELASVVLVSTRLFELLGGSVTPEQAARLFEAEMSLRELGGLPPSGCLYEIRAVSSSFDALEEFRPQLGDALQREPGTRLLRLSRVFAQGLYLGKPAQRLSGLLVNEELGAAQLLGLRALAARHKVSLRFRALRGPWP